MLIGIPELSGYKIDIPKKQLIGYGETVKLQERNDYLIQEIYLDPKDSQHWNYQETLLYWKRQGLDLVKRSQEYINHLRNE